eukprot:TRINITY_DN8708_c0_g1_i1.p1 TRINITY_DN8708_c0_g1~~TRINITY_DN8708_c0_g1_i1.p1  ORF type:complete len:177 (+),score=58.06 TRINITY_DN8708_c0_g1_i1:55-531(+)
MKLLFVLLFVASCFAETSYNLVSGNYACILTGTVCRQVEHCASASTTQVPTSESTMPHPEVGVTCCDTSGVGTRPGCLSGVSFATAAAHCTDNGLSLCTTAQIKAGAGEATGCGFDIQLVWTSDICEDECSVGDGPYAACQGTSKAGFKSIGKKRGRL